MIEPFNYYNNYLAKAIHRYYFFVLFKFRHSSKLAPVIMLQPVICIYRYQKVSKADR